jgi:hypothetical protein
LKANETVMRDRYLRSMNGHRNDGADSGLRQW